MTGPYRLPCNTQFTVREFEEYLFHREQIRIVIRTLLGVDAHPESMLGTSYFEFRFRKSSYRPQSDTMLLTVFVCELFKTTDIQEISVVSGDGTSLDYVRSDDDEEYCVVVKLHGDDPRHFLTLGEVRSTYSRSLFTETPYTETYAQMLRF